MFKLIRNSKFELLNLYSNTSHGWNPLIKTDRLTRYSYRQITIVNCHLTQMLKLLRNDEFNHF